MLLIKHFIHIAPFIKEMSKKKKTEKKEEKNHCSWHQVLVLVLIVLYRQYQVAAWTSHYLSCMQTVEEKA